VNIRDLLDVRVICETGSLRKAAAVLGVTQPTLGARISHLEDQLGALLFDRSRGQSRPTELALFIADRAAGLADEAAQLTREARRLASCDAGIVHLGLGPGPMRILLPALALMISERYPGITIEAVSGSTAQLTEGLLGARLDLLVCPPLDDGGDKVASETVLETDLVVVAHPDHPLCLQAPADIAAAFRYPMASSFFEKRYLDMLREGFGIEFAAQAGRVVCSDFDVLVRIVTRSQRLFTAGPRFVFEPEIAAGTLRVIDLQVPLPHFIQLHQLRDRRPLPVVETVAGVIREAFNPGGSLSV
jgi:DNA-binding transcriptional LysR family regulator